MEKSKNNYISLLNTLDMLNGITVTKIGDWLWIEGNTYENKELLKSFGCRWSKSNKKWYYTEKPIRGKCKAMTYDYKVNKYGKETIKEDRMQVTL